MNFLTGEGGLFGVDINTGGIADSFANFVWEPAVVKVFIYFLILNYLVMYSLMLFFDVCIYGTVMMENNCRSMLSMLLPRQLALS